MSILPKKNDLGFYEIRLESIGGLGANLAGKMLAEAGVFGLGLNGSNFASYGSEKKGSPVKSFIRFCDHDTEIRIHSPIEEPHVVGVFHEALYMMVDVASGLGPDGILLVNTRRSFDEIKSDLKIGYGTIATVDALGIAVEEKTKVNTAMLGALFRICDFLDPESMKDVIRKTFEKKYPHLVEPNICTFERGYQSVQFKTYQSDSKGKQFTRPVPQLGFLTQEIGGVLTAQANSILKDLGGSRQGFLPKFDQEECIHCAACDTACPDFCFVWSEGEDKRGRKQMFLQGIDYQYCKGCLKCVEACPTTALSDLRESIGYAEDNQVKTFISICDRRDFLMAVLEETLKSVEAAEQVTTFESGNEMAAMAAAQINYHIMGYFPITPSTEVAQYLDQMKARGEHDIKLIAADGEHGSAGICYGAAATGARVFNATSANGLMYMLEQLPVQSGTRFPMVMNLVTRAISGPLDIRGDHSDLYFALNTGWVILTARTPQAVYDMNIMALKIAEHSDVRLPVMVAYDGFFTSHQKRRVHYFKDRKVVQKFVGDCPTDYHFARDPERPVTIGAHMNGDDLINNHFQQSEAMYKAADVYKEVAQDYARLSGREYGILDLYKMDDAEVALFLLNSAAESAKDVVDKLRAQGVKAGVISPNIIRPFPAEEIREALKNVKSVLVGERADSYGGHGPNLTLEVKAALKDDKWNETIVLSRVFGLGGKDFYADDAEAFFNIAIDAMNKGYADRPFDYYGHTPGNPDKKLTPVIAPQHGECYNSGLVTVSMDEESSKLKVKIPPLRALTSKPKRIASGHGACPGCGIFGGLETFFKGIEGDIVVLYQTGCAYVTTTAYPYTSHKQTMIHNLFQNGAATLSGTVEAFMELKERGEIEVASDATFVMITGDGGMDIGMGSAIGTALRNHKLIVLEYDNEGYMNTGSQMSYSTPMGHMTSTTNIGKVQKGKAFHHKDTAQIMAATNIPYVFTGTEAFPQDLVKKAAKAQWYAQNVGTVYGKILITCPLNWKSEDRYGQTIIEAAVNSNFFPLYEVEQGQTAITYDPEARKKKIPLAEWLKWMGKTKHLLADENKEFLTEFEKEVERRWHRLKAKHENTYL